MSLAAADPAALAVPAHAAPQAGLVIAGGAAGGTPEKFATLSEPGGTVGAPLRLLVRRRAHVKGHADRRDVAGVRHRSSAARRREGKRTILVVTGSAAWASGSGQIQHGAAATHRTTRTSSATSRSGWAAGWTLGDLERGGRGPASGSTAPTPPSTSRCCAPPTRRSRRPTRRPPSSSARLTGNNYAFLRSAYAGRRQGLLRRRLVHTDTACLVDGPAVDFLPRRAERPRSRSSRSWATARSARSMLANGDDKPIHMSELGWSASTPQPARAASGRARRPSGVTEAEQAAVPHARPTMPARGPVRRRRAVVQRPRPATRRHRAELLRPQALRRLAAARVRRVQVASRARRQRHGHRPVRRLHGAAASRSTARSATRRCSTTWSVDATSPDKDVHRA